MCRLAVVSEIIQSKTVRRFNLTGRPPGVTQGVFVVIRLAQLPRSPFVDSFRVAICPNPAGQAIAQVAIQHGYCARDVVIAGGVSVE